MSKNLDETVRLQSEKREEWIREIRERLQGIAEGASSTPRLASSSAVSFSGRNECPGTYCSLIEQEEREDSSVALIFITGCSLHVPLRSYDVSVHELSNVNVLSTTVKMLSVC